MTRNSGRAAALLLLRRSGTALCEDTDEFLPSPHPMVEPSTVEALDLDSDMPPFPDGGDHHVVPPASNGLEVGGSGCSGSPNAHGADLAERLFLRPVL